MTVKKVFLLILALAIYGFSYSHVIPKIETEIVPLSALELFWEYLQLGFLHVIPKGFDHILFILGILLLNNSWRPVLLQCSVFTLAHSITLAFCASELIIPNTKWVEVVIALSIVIIAVENIFQQKMNNLRLVIIFIFGLIHGMGFANALKELGLPANYFWGSLISFNVGVEMAQISILLIAWFGLVNWIKTKNWYRQRFVIPISICIGLIALYWVTERMMGK
jgi:hydrogenase/urease accessory protein HupE